MLLLALIFYLKYEAPPEEQNFPMVMELLRAGDIDEENEAEGSALDDLFAMLEAKNPNHIALKYYKSYRSGSAKTLKSIQITLAARLEKFNLESLATLTSTDELDLQTLGEKKVGNGSKIITVRSYQRSFELLLQKQKIPHHGFHALRHTFATRAIECGMDVKSLSEILGHKNPTITLKRYVHSFMEHKREFMNRLGKLL